MPLPLPKLDNLRYDTLVGAALDLLPYRAPQWTDFNAHDPGITLLELLAWITENGSYRLDRVTPAAERAFLRLMGIEPLRARTALTVVMMQPVGAAGAVVLPPGIQIASADKAVRFQTSSAQQLVSARISRVLSRTKRGWMDFSTANNTLESSFLPLGETPEEGDALYFGLDAALAPAGGRVGLFVFGEDLSRDYETWLVLREEYRHERRLILGGCRRRSRCAPGFWNHYGVTVAWEYFDGTRWRGLERVRDATRALSLSGPVRFRAPGEAAHQKGGVSGAADSWFVRCRVVKGRYDCPPRMRGARINALIARHAADNARTTLGKSSGHAGQRFFVSDDPVVPGSTRLEVKVGAHLEPGWEERPDFDRSGPLARNFVVADGIHGEIIFGDGRNGFVPETGAELSASWQTGGGRNGNVPAETLATLPVTGAASAVPGWNTISAAIQVQQPVAAVVGADREPLAAAKARAVRLLAESRCAVTLEDYERLARAVPGVPVARARAVAEIHPRFNCLPAAGCITVVVMTACARRHPEPTLALCRAVRRYLDARRPAAVELHVTGPKWTRIAVRAKLRLGAGAGAAAVRAEAERLINAFLDPLTGGPDGAGWPIGRSVYRSEIYAVLQEVGGVVLVDELALKAGDNSLDLCNNLELCPNGMPLPGVHEISTTTGGGQ